MQDVVLPVTTAHLLHAALGYAAFLLLLYLGSIALPGSRKLGFAQPSGAREEYKLSGLGLFLLWLVGFFAPRIMVIVGLQSTMV